MFEAIAANRRRSFWLLTLMGLLLAALGAAIGGAVEPRVGWALGLLIAFVIWLGLWLTARVGGDSILLASAGARRVEKNDAPLLHNVVEEMMIAAGLPKMPAVYIIDDAAPNAFAVGRTPQVAAVAVTTGLLKRLTRDELQGVIGHEIGHVKNLDIRFMTLAAVMVGAIAMLGEGFVRGMYYGGVGRGGGRRRGGDSGGGQAQAIFMVVAVVLAILAPLFARLLYMACSRQREYLADASSARFTRFPEGLASALEKISRGAVAQKEKPQGNAALAPLYIVNPRQAVGGREDLFATHPPVERRVAILRSLAGSGQAGLAAYEAAYEAANGGKRVLGGRTLAEDPELVGLRAPTPEPAPQAAATDRAREAIRVFDRLAGLAVIPCACGLAVKIPGDWPQPTVKCPRCGRVHGVEEARKNNPEALRSNLEQEGNAGAPGGAGGVRSGAGGPLGGAALAGLPLGAETAGVRRKQIDAESIARSKLMESSGERQVWRIPPGAHGWQQFQCRCGHTFQLSPGFGGDQISCPECAADVRIARV